MSARSAITRSVEFALLILGGHPSIRSEQMHTISKNALATIHSITREVSQAVENVDLVSRTMISIVIFCTSENYRGSFLPAAAVQTFGKKDIHGSKAVLAATRTLHARVNQWRNLACSKQLFRTCLSPHPDTSVAVGRRWCQYYESM